jgi:hypothetical protein
VRVSEASSVREVHLSHLSPSTFITFMLRLLLADRKNPTSPFKLTSSS